MMAANAGVNTSIAAPSSLDATTVSATQINLTWVDNASAETGFKIERDSGGGYSQIGTAAANATSYSDTGLTPGVTYTYRVRAYDGGGNGAYSNTDSATTTAYTLQDTFTDTNGTSLASHTATIGGAWTVAVGAGEIQSNTLLANAATMEATLANTLMYGTISCEVKCGAATASFAPEILFWYENTNNYWMVALEGDSQLILYQMVSGSLVARRTESWTADTSWHTLLIDLEFDGVRVKLDGTTKMFYPVNWWLQTNGKVGVRGFKSGTADAFENLTFIGEALAYTTINNDTFTDANGTALASHTPNTGANWTVRTGSFTVESNKAQAGSATSEAYIATNYRDALITCDIQCGAASNQHAPGLVVAGIDASNYWLVYPSGDGNLIVYERIAGVLNSRASTTWSADTSSHTLKVVCLQHTIYVWLDGVIKLTVDTSARSVKGGQVGIRGFVNAGNSDKFDNFKVEVLTEAVIAAYPSPFATLDLTDTFTQSNGTQLSTLGYVEQNGDWEVQSNKAQQGLTAGPVTGYLVTYASAAANHGAKIAVTTPAAGSFVTGLNFRTQDLTHFHEFEINTLSGYVGPRGCGVWSYNNTGTFLAIATHSLTAAAATTYTMRVRVVGHIIVAEVVESSITMVCSSSLFETDTKVGLFESRDGVNTPNANVYDSFEVYTT